MNKWLIALLLSISFTAPCSDTRQVRTLVVVFDGLRPDYITPELMPNLYAFRKKGCYGASHHSVFPTVTRVNAAAYATGSYPGKNGLLGNNVYFPEVDKAKELNTEAASTLDRVDSATGGHLLTAVSLGEVLASAGARMMVFSDGSVGQALLQNHKINGAVINTDLIRPDTFRRKVYAEMGAPPAEEPLNAPRHKWITDAFLKYGLAEDGPLVSSIWYTDPDATAHQKGIGSPSAVACLKIVDAQFGRILDSLRSRNLEASFNIIITADHGFITGNVGTGNLSQFLVSRGLKKSAGSEDVIVAEKAVYVKDRDTQLIKKIVSALQEQEWVGAIFTRASHPGALTGWVKGTLSFDAVHWDHPTRSGDILVAENWDDRKNMYGYSGTTYLKSSPGWHGGSSPYEVHIALMADGPSFKKAYRSDLPTSNVDIAPTILYLCHIPVPDGMDGRVMYELLNTKKADQKLVPKTETVRTHTRCGNGIYTITLQRTLLGKYSYVDYIKADRDKK